MNKNPSDLNASENLSEVIRQRDDMEKKLEFAKKKIEEKKRMAAQKKELIKLNKEYRELTYPERHPILYKLKRIFSTFKKESNDLINKANEHNRNNPWN